MPLRDTVHRSKTIKLDQEIATLEGQLIVYDALWERLEALRERKKKLEQSNITPLRRQWPWHERLVYYLPSKLVCQACGKPSFVAMLCNWIAPGGIYPSGHWTNNELGYFCCGRVVSA